MNSIITISARYSPNRCIQLQGRAFLWISKKLRIGWLRCWMRNRGARNRRRWQSAWRKYNWSICLRRNKVKDRCIWRIEISMTLATTQESSIPSRTGLLETSANFGLRDHANEALATINWSKLFMEVRSSRRGFEIGKVWTPRHTTSTWVTRIPSSSSVSIK